MGVARSAGRGTCLGLVLVVRFARGLRRFATRRSSVRRWNFVGRGVTFISLFITVVVIVFIIMVSGRSASADGLLVVVRQVAEDFARDGPVCQSRMLQIVEQFGGRLISVLGFLGHHPLQDGRHSLGDVRLLVARIGDRFDRVSLQLVGDASFGVGRLARQHLIPGAAERIEVAANVGQLAVASLFGRHVVHRAHCRAGASDVRFERIIDRTSQTKVRHFHHAVARDQQVRRLDVAVNNVLFVGVLQCSGDLLDDLDRTLDGRDAPSLHHLEQILTLDILHRDEQVTVSFTRIVHRDDVVVAELGRRLSLGLEPFDQRRILSLVP